MYAFGSGTPLPENKRSLDDLFNGKPAASRWTLDFGRLKKEKIIVIR